MLIAYLALNWLTNSLAAKGLFVEDRALSRSARERALTIRAAWSRSASLANLLRVGRW
jgi:hypothetical protein